SPTAAPTVAPTPTAATGTVVNATKTGLGIALVDNRGFSLYMFEKDTSSTSACTGACAAAWPPLLTTGAPVAGNGVRADLLAPIKRSDGTLQVTYAGHPLYLYVGDTKAGDITGQNSKAFGAEWYLVSPAGHHLGS